MTEVVDGLLAVRQLANGGVDIEPDQPAFIVEVGVATVSRPLSGREVQQLRGGRRVAQRTPTPPRLVVEKRGYLCEPLFVVGPTPNAAPPGKHVAEILCQALVHPQQIANHRLLKVWRR